MSRRALDSAHCALHRAPADISEAADTARPHRWRLGLQLPTTALGSCRRYPCLAGCPKADSTRRCDAASQPVQTAISSAERRTSSSQLELRAAGAHGGGDGRCASVGSAGLARRAPAPARHGALTPPSSSARTPCTARHGTSHRHREASAATTALRPAATSSPFARRPGASGSRIQDSLIPRGPVIWAAICSISAG